MDLRHLRYFVAIVEHGSLSKASTAIKIAQPALSLHVRNMEAELGASLLYRTKFGVATTAAGAILLRNARTIIDRFTSAENELRDHKSNPREELQISMVRSVSEYLSVPLAVAVRRAFPDIRLSVSMATSAVIADRLREGKSDLAILYDDTNNLPVCLSPLHRERLCLICPADQAFPQWRQQEPASFDDIAALPLVMPGIDDDLRIWMESMARSNNKMLRTEMTVSSYDHVRELVALGMGCAVLPANIVPTTNADARLRVIPIEKSLGRQIVFARRHHLDSKRGAIEAIETLCRTLFFTIGDGSAWVNSSGSTAIDPRQSPVIRRSDSDEHKSVFDLKSMAS